VNVARRDRHHDSGQPSIGPASQIGAALIDGNHLQSVTHHCVFAVMPEAWRCASGKSGMAQKLLEVHHLRRDSRATTRERAAVKR
jgi:hypothetical protein